jgi:hypothetical protein
MYSTGKCFRTHVCKLGREVRMERLIETHSHCKRWYSNLKQGPPRYRQNYWLDTGGRILFVSCTSICSQYVTKEAENRIEINCARRVPEQNFATATTVLKVDNCVIASQFLSRKVQKLDMSVGLYSGER